MSSVRVTTVNPTTPTLLVFNTSYITTRLGLLKLLLLSLSLLCFILILIETQKASCARGGRRQSDGAPCYKIFTGDLFLLLVCFNHLYVVFLMMITSLLSVGNASLMPKTHFDHIFHYVASFLYLIGGLWVLIDSVSDGRTATIILAALFAIISSFGHVIHGLFSYRKSLLI